MKSNSRPQPGYISEFGDTRLPLHSARLMPSLSEPEFMSGLANPGIRPRDEVLGVSLFGISRAYPTWIMDNIHMVNDWFESDPFLVIH